MRASRPRSTTRLAAALLGSILLAAAPVALAAEEDPAPLRARAVAAYDAGRYAEARPLLQQLVDRGAADGAVLYRLHYCLRAAGDAAWRALLERARETLEREAPQAADLEAPFYLANAYANLGRPADARRVAGESTARVERGELAIPADGVGLFRLGKLYADQGDGERARARYAAALDAFEREGSGPEASAYVRWAARDLAEAAFAAGRYDEAERYYGMLAESGEPSVEDLDRLAVSRVRLGLYREAAQAWRRIERMVPAEADRARYGSRAAESAAGLGTLPATAADGRLWIDLGPADLEAAMAAQVEALRGAIAEARAAKKLKRKLRTRLETTIGAAHAVFLAAALEYQARGLDLRALAFQGGFAPLVFKPAEWAIPESPPPS